MRIAPRILAPTVVAMLLALLSLLPTAVSTRAVYAAAGCFNEPGAGKGTVVLDPGHGAEDSGARNTTQTGKLLLEKDVVLDIAFRATELLTAKGYRVCLTRTDDTTNPGNSERGQYANSVNAKVLVLVHLNGSSDSNVNYTQTFWGKKNKDLKFSQWMHDALYPTLDDVDWNGSRDYKVGDRGVGQFATGALLKASMPGTLTESLFLTNKDEVERLADDQPVSVSPRSRRQQIATALADGINSWLTR